MIPFYVICLVISVIVLLWFLSLGEQHSTLQTLLLVAVIIANAGHLTVALAGNLEQAILGQKLTYIGGCFIPLIMFLIIAKISHIKIPKFLVIEMTIAQIIIFMLVCSIGQSKIFYENVYLVRYGTFSALGKEYGKGHLLHQAATIFYMASGLVICLFSFGRKTVVSYKNVTKLVFALAIGTLVYFGERRLGLKIELMPFVYSMQTFLALMPVIRNNTYSINSNAQDIFDEFSDVGYVVFDKKMRYMGCDDKALRIFPELLKYRLEYVLTDKNSSFTDIFLPILKDSVKSKEKGIVKTDIFPLGDNYYQYRLATILKGRRKVGYIFEITDVTIKERSIKLIENYNKDLEDEVKRQTEEIKVIRDKTMLGMAQMVESRDLSTGGHIKRTSVVVSIFAKELLKSDLGLTEDFLKNVERAAPMHDLGKIAVEDKVLRKQGRFTDEEYTEMKKHAAAGAEIVSKILTGIEDPEFVNIAINVAHFHHEKFDGNGYPDKISGDAIPIEARIMAYADVFDALVSKRCYKEAYDYDKAFNIINESIGTHFDPKLASAFMACRSELEEFYSTQS